MVVRHCQAFCFLVSSQETHQHLTMNVEFCSQDSCLHRSTCRSLLLGAMADLLENPKSHPFFHNWRSDGNGQSAAHLLISLWQVRGLDTGGEVVLSVLSVNKTLSHLLQLVCLCRAAWAELDCTGFFAAVANAVSCLVVWIA